MKPSIVTLSVVFVTGFLGGCPSDDGNPAVLWLALDGSELEVKLVDEEPRPY